VIASELPGLLQAALALRRIRNARLFRTEAVTFSEYLARRYSLSVGVIREVMGAIAASEELIRDLALRPDDPDREGRLRTVGLGRYALAPVIKPLRTGRPGRPRKEEEHRRGLAIARGLNSASPGAHY
jgi:hypothetical protein